MLGLFFLYVLLTIALLGLYWLGRLVLYLFGRGRKKATLVENLDQDFTKFIRKNKIRRWILLIWGTLGALVVIFTAFMWINSNHMEKLYQKTSDQANDYLTTQAPNIGTNNQMISVYGIFSSNLHMDVYKNVDGYQITWPAFNFSFATFGLYGYALDNDNYYMNASPVTFNNGYYTQSTNQKIAAFFNVGADFKSKKYFGLQPTHDAHLLKNAPNQLAEVAVTFKKPLTYAEIIKLVPKNLLINWYWLGINDTKAEGANEDAQYFGINANTDISDQTEKLGALDKDTYSEFVRALKEYKATSTIDNFNPLQDARKQIKKYPTLAKAKFAGVILTGRTQNFASLDKEKWVFATNTGVMTAIRPDVPPTK